MGSDDHTGHRRSTLQRRSMEVRGQEVVPRPLTMLKLLLRFVRKLLQQLQPWLQRGTRCLTQLLGQSLQLRANFRCTLAG